MNKNPNHSLVRVNAIAISELLIGLQDGCHTMWELSDLCGLSIQTVRHYCKILHRKGIVHISDWREDHRGGRTLKVFELGSGSDMPKPKPMSKAESCKRHRQKMKQAKLLQMMAANTGEYKEAA